MCAVFPTFSMLTGTPKMITDLRPLATKGVKKSTNRLIPQLSNVDKNSERMREKKIKKGPGFSNSLPVLRFCFSSSYNSPCIHMDSNISPCCSSAVHFLTTQIFCFTETVLAEFRSSLPRRHCQ